VSNSVNLFELIGDAIIS